MDLFSHFVLPFLLVWALRRPLRERLAAGIGGVAPDMDAATAVLGLLHDDIWFLGHRGVSHSLVGAPLYALAAAGLLSLPSWGERWPRLRALRFDARMLLLAALFSYTHLALDGLTMWGVPLLMPWSLQRFGLDWYFYSVVWAIPFSAAFVWLLWKGGREARLRQVGTILVVLLVLSGGVRLAWRPDAPDAIRVMPAGGVEWAWASVHAHPDGYEVQLWSFAKPGRTLIVEHEDVLPPDESKALEAARASSLGKGFVLYAGWPIAERVDPAPDGDGHDVTLTDVMRRAQLAERPSFLARLDDFGVVKLRVDADGVREAPGE